MPTPLIRYKIFLASPGDLLDDRASIDEAIDELNLTFGKQNDIHLELIKWETHSAPAISKTHVQNIINKDVGNDYDLFIGLLWKRFGTPTDEADSGTEEEFLNAYKRFQENPESLQILFYFKNTPFSLDEIDPEQLKKIKEFKSDISKNKNVLYGEYNNTKQLTSFLRIHISKRILELHRNNEENSMTISTKVVDIIVPEITIEEEYGLIDYQDIFDESIEESNQSLHRISDAMEWVTEQFSKKTTEITALTLNKNQPPSRKLVREVMKKTAKIMNNFGNRIELETPIFFDNFELAIDSLQQSLNIYRNDFDVDLEEVKVIRDALSGLIENMEESVPSTEGFIESIESFPRMSKEINAAKTDLSMILNKLLDNFKIALSIAIELRKSFDDFLD